MKLTDEQIKNLQDRINAFEEFLSDFTPEGWDRFINKILSELGGITVVLVDDTSYDIDDVPVRTLPVEITLAGGSLNLNPKGYGDYSSVDGKGACIALDYFDNKLQTLVFADINKADPTHIIDMAEAKESARK